MLSAGSCHRRSLLALAALTAAITLVASTPDAGAVNCPTLLDQGDTTTQIDVNGAIDVVHQFSSPGATQFVPPATVTQVEYLVVGAGGGGGARYGGGGGGGAVLTGIMTVTAGVGLDVTVGAGGVGGVRRASGVAHGPGSNGASSALASVVAQGGGGGGAGNQSTNSVGRPGASGGGGGGGPLDQYVVTYGGGTGLQGNNGGAGTFAGAYNYFQGLTAGGGGGAGSTGGAGDRRSGVGLAGMGGAGANSTISGTSVWYAGGGGGGAFHVNQPNAGRDGGGDGTNTDTQPARAVRGGGGGGGGLSTQGWDGSAGGDGGDGVVIVRYAMPPLAPCAPVITSVTSGDGEAEVAFTPPSSDGGSPISNYEYSSDGGATWQAFSPSVIASPVVIGGLTNDSLSALALRAVNVAGPGPSSNVMSVTPTAPTTTTAPPSLPADLPSLVTTPAPVGPPVGPPVITTVSPATTTTTEPTLPLVLPGEVLVTRDGRPVDAAVFATEASGLTLLHGDSRLRVSARCNATCPPLLLSDQGGATLQAEAEAELLLTATGLRPGAAVTIWIFSEPTLLANSVLDPQGTYTGVVPLDGVPAGQHTLQFNSIGRTGERLSFHLALNLVSQAVDPPIELPSTGRGMSPVVVVVASAWMLLGIALVRRSTLRTR